LVVAGGVELEVSEEFAVGSGGADVEVFDEGEHWLATMAAADADVVELAVVSQGELAAGVDGVVADSIVGVVERHARR
jgi:hypothetical protein